MPAAQGVAAPDVLLEGPQIAAVPDPQADAIEVPEVVRQIGEVQAHRVDDGPQLERRWHDSAHPRQHLRGSAPANLLRAKVVQQHAPHAGVRPMQGHHGRQRPLEGEAVVEAHLPEELAAPGHGAVFLLGGRQEAGHHGAVQAERAQTRGNGQARRETVGRVQGTGDGPPQPQPVSDSLHRRARLPLPRARPGARAARAAHFAVSSDCICPSIALSASAADRSPTQTAFCASFQSTSISVDFRGSWWPRRPRMASR